MKRTVGISSMAISILLLASALSSEDLRLQRDRPLVADSWRQCVETLENMLTVATAVEAYGIDYGEYPKAANMAELRALIEPHYIAHAALQDAWGTEYRYVRSPNGKRYRLASAGSDRTFEVEPSRGGALLTSSKDDAVLTEDPAQYREWIIQR